MLWLLTLIILAEVVLLRFLNSSVQLGLKNMLVAKGSMFFVVCCLMPRKLSHLFYFILFYLFIFIVGLKKKINLGPRVPSCLEVSVLESL